MISIGSFEIRYYGLMWALALGISAYIFSRIIKREGYPDKLFDSIFWYGVLSTIIGARLGHCLFYDPGYYLTHPVEILYIIREDWPATARPSVCSSVCGFFRARTKCPTSGRSTASRSLSASPARSSRIGNLMNSEIYGHATSLPWGFVFVRAGETQPMHPTQIYEAAAYLVLFGILCWMYYGPKLALRRPGLMFGFFLIYLFGFRFLVEFIKNPQEEFERTMTLNMGQWLSIPFIVLGIVILYRACRRPAVELPKTKR